MLVSIGSEKMGKEKEEKKNLPETKFRAGTVTATVWSKMVDVNKKKVKFYNVTFEKSYKDKDDEWQTTNSYGREDLVKLEIVNRKAMEYIFLTKEKDEDDE